VAQNRPVLVLQNAIIQDFSTTIIVVPFTANMRRAELPTCMAVQKGEGGLTADSVLLCHHVRAIDHARLRRRMGRLKAITLVDVENCILYTLGIV
jgi:mRNA interferase MazF